MASLSKTRTFCPIAIARIGSEEKWCQTTAVGFRETSSFRRDRSFPTRRSSSPKDVARCRRPARRSATMTWKRTSAASLDDALVVFAGDRAGELVRLLASFSPIFGGPAVVEALRVARLARSPPSARRGPPRGARAASTRTRRCAHAAELPPRAVDERAEEAARRAGVAGRALRRRRGRRARRRRSRRGRERTAMRVAARLALLPELAARAAAERRAPGLERRAHRLGASRTRACGSRPSGGPARRRAGARRVVEGQRSDGRSSATRDVLLEGALASR